MVAIMRHEDEVQFELTPRSGNEMAVGAGASIMVAVATALVLMLTLLVASLSSAHAMPLPAISAGGALNRSLVLASVQEPVQQATYQITAVETPRDDTYLLRNNETGEHYSLATLLLVVVVCGSLSATANLWHQLASRALTGLRRVFTR
ncbi:hypothetical protein [Oryzibacter oryziterrae]|uniref:hypothetical protein n=1 Tax=Oryzibacter oryziterrae TaxID=2766474 RepID=UPI001F265987|nr:hypothetical protein [Oryzibacter oryziterrae]